MHEWWVARGLKAHGVKAACESTLVHRHSDRGAIHLYKCCMHTVDAVGDLADGVARSNSACAHFTSSRTEKTSFAGAWPPQRLHSTPSSKKTCLNECCHSTFLQMCSSWHKGHHMLQIPPPLIIICCRVYIHVATRTAVAKLRTRCIDAAAAATDSTFSLQRVNLAQRGHPGTATMGATTRGSCMSLHGDNYTYDTHWCLVRAAHPLWHARQWHRSPPFALLALCTTARPRADRTASNFSDATSDE